MIKNRNIQREIKITKEDLISFESVISDTFEKGLIHGPVHLSYGNEDYLIKFFEYINPNDWVFSTWRNHYHALLHGVPKNVLMDKIMEGRSISFQCAENHLYTSAIVSGIIPIAVGAALGIKWSEDKNRMVWCFVGDMASESGVFYEAVKYSIRNSLPIHFVIEDNQLSTNTPTQDSWGKDAEWYNYKHNFSEACELGYISMFEYVRDKYPHVGIGKWIHF